MSTGTKAQGHMTYRQLSAQVDSIHSSLDNAINYYRSKGRSDQELAPLLTGDLKQRQINLNQIRRAMRAEATQAFTALYAPGY
jgi:hypothetical protein